MKKVNVKMNINRREIKHEARKAIKGNILKLGILVLLISQVFYGMIKIIVFISGLVLIVFAKQPPLTLLYYLGWTLLTIQTWLFILGSCSIYLELVKGNKKYLKYEL